MEANHIQELYEYNRWANSRILDSVTKLTPEEFTRNLGNSFPSVRDTLTHIMSAEWIWLMRWQGTSPKAMISPMDFPELPVLRTRWTEIEMEQKKFVTGLSGEALETRITYVNIKGDPFTYPLWKMMRHVVNHSTYHRGQITTMLRQLGAKPISTDLLVFYDLISKTI